MFGEHRKKVEVEYFVKVGHVFGNGYLLDQRVHQETQRDACLIFKKISEVREVVFSNLNVTRVLDQREYQGLVYGRSCCVFLLSKFI